MNTATREISQKNFDAAVKKVLDIAHLKQLVSFEKIPGIFKEDFERFIFGKTLMKTNKGEFCVYPWDFKQWVRKIQYNGLDYNIRITNVGEKK